MNYTLDGLNFDWPPTKNQIIELAHMHRRNLKEAVFRDIHLGDYCLAQRKRVYDFTRSLDEQQREDFYRVYNGELKRIAEEDKLHPAHAESGVSVFTIGIFLVLIAIILYFAIVRSLIQ